MLNQISRTIKEDGTIISTIKPVYMAWFGEYETAISFDNQKTWNIAEGYDTKEEAEKGHDKYANMSTEQLLSKTDWIA